MSTDAIVLLREDHKEIKRLFRSFEQAEKSAQKQKLVKQILQMLAVHTYIENEGMYPQVRKAVPDIESDILESYEEHHVADLLMAELAEMTPDDERFTAKVTVLIESVEHHIEEEESAWFPDVREALGRKQLQEIGAQMLKLRKKAPRQPKRMKTELVEPTPARSAPSKSAASKSAASKSAASKSAASKSAASKSAPSKSAPSKSAPSKSAPSKSAASKSSASKSSATKPAAKKSTARKASASKASASKATQSRPPANEPADSMVPAQADLSSLPSLTPPPLPGPNGDIALLDASVPGAQTQDAPDGAPTVPA